MAFYLAIVSPLDAPLFELQFTTSKPGNSTANSVTFPTWSTFTGANGSDLAPSSAASTLSNQVQVQQQNAQNTPNAQQAQGQLQQQQQQNLAANMGVAAGAPGDRHLLQMIAHAGLDAVEEVAEGSGSLYLKAVDRHNEWTVSAFLATNVKLILLHDVKNDDGIRLFFGDVWELYTKILLNPFHTVNTPIRNPAFEAKVRMSAKRYL